DRRDRAQWADRRPGPARRRARRPPEERPRAATAPRADRRAAGHGDSCGRTPRIPRRRTYRFRRRRTTRGEDPELRAPRPGRAAVRWTAEGWAGALFLLRRDREPHPPEASAW